MQRRRINLHPLIAQGENLPAQILHHHNRQTEHTTHGGAQCLGRIQIRAVGGHQDHIHAEGFRCADDGADIPRVLQRGEDDDSILFYCIKLCAIVKYGKNAEHPLGGLRVGKFMSQLLGNQVIFGRGRQQSLTVLPLQ